MSPPDEAVKSHFNLPVVDVLVKIKQVNLDVPVGSVDGRAAADVSHALKPFTINDHLDCKDAV